MTEWRVIFRLEVNHMMANTKYTIVTLFTVNWIIQMIYMIWTTLWDPNNIELNYLPGWKQIVHTALNNNNNNNNNTEGMNVLDNGVKEITRQKTL